MAVGRPERKLFCPRCGAANSSNASACQACGQDLRLVAAAVIRRHPVRRRSVYVAGAGVLLLLLVSLGSWWLLQARSRAVEQAQLDHYLNGVRATEVGRWDLAAAEFAAAGQYRDAPQRRAEAESRLGQVEERYEDALAALGRGDTWQAAFALFQVVQAVPSYRDAVEVLDRARAELGPLLLFRRAAPDGGTPVVSTPEGGEQDVLTDGPGLPTAAEIAANGRHVLVEIVRSGRSDLWLWQLRSDGRLAPEDGQLLASRARDAWGRFSPDSRWLLFGWQGERGWSLATVAARGGQAARLVRDADFVAGAFAATGDAIGFRAREEGRWRLGLVEPGSEEPEHLVRDADEFGALEISPDGRHVLYGYVRDGSYRLKLRPVDSAEAFEPAPDSEFVWARFSPDGRRLLVWIWQNHLGQLVLTDMQGQRERVLASGAADAWGEFSPDGREIVYGVWNGRTWRVMLVGTQADGEIVLAEAVDDAQASFAPGGRWLLYSLWQNGQWELALRDVEDGSERAIVGGAEFVSALVQPDNEHLLVWYVPAGQDAATLAVAEAATGRRIALAQNLTAAAGAFARNGGTVALALQSAMGEAPGVFVANADGTGLLEFAPDSYRVYWAQAPFAFGARPPLPN